MIVAAVNRFVPVVVVEEGWRRSVSVVCVVCVVCVVWIDDAAASVVGACLVEVSSIATDPFQDVVRCGLPQENVPVVRQLQNGGVPVFSMRACVYDVFLQNLAANSRGR